MKKRFEPQRIGAYFRAEWAALCLVTASGLIYNLGLLAGPWFEGKMAGRLIDCLNGQAGFRDMLALVGWYALITAAVQGARYVKRFYVRRFANNVNRRMKRVLYANLVRRSRSELAGEGMGEMLTRAISDVDDCAEGMRKFTTELFDTGVALAAYACMLLSYDWRLALTCLIFPPLAFVIAEKLKAVVQRAGAAYKKQAGALSAATLDRASNALTYRVFGCERERGAAYERELDGYESAAVKANLLTAALPPVYRVLAMAGALPILLLGARNVQGTGWQAWDVAAFATFLSCFTRLAAKSSGAAKLFNAVHRAQVSWRRISPLMREVKPLEQVQAAPSAPLHVRELGFAYPGGEKIFAGLSFDAQPGEIIGVTGPVASGKSTLGKAFLCEYPYEGSVRFGEKELSGLTESQRAGVVGYLGHDPELFSASVEESVLLGDAGDAEKYLKAVCLDGEVAAMEEGLETQVGSGGVRLSGGQAQRLALARTLAHPRPVLVLDDPFSALDRGTEDKVFENLKQYARDKVVILISHRLYHFPEMQRVVFMEEGRCTVDTHAGLCAAAPAYRALYESQTGGAAHEA